MRSLPPLTPETTFRALLAVDALAVILIVGSSSGARSAPDRAVTEGCSRSLAAATATTSWALAAVAAGAITRPGGPSSVESRTRRARRLVTAGLVVNTVGSLAALAVATSGHRPRVPDIARSAFLLVGGAAISVAYLAVVGNGMRRAAASASPGRR